MAVLCGSHGVVGALGRQGHISQPHPVPCCARYTQGLIGRPLQAAVQFSLFRKSLLWFAQVKNLLWHGINNAFKEWYKPRLLQGTTLCSMELHIWQLLLSTLTKHSSVQA